MKTKVIGIPGACLNCNTFHEDGGPADYPRACRDAGTYPRVAVNDEGPLPDNCQSPHFCVGCEAGSHPWQQDDFDLAEYEASLEADRLRRLGLPALLAENARLAKIADDECPF